MRIETADPTRLDQRQTRPTVGLTGATWVAWHSKVRIAVLTVALFMALC